VYIPPLLHPVELFGMWAYYLMILSVTDNQIETDQVGDTGEER
jgi:hypothetical protein